jgi:tetratricopeptide (TPR) repeat protein
LDAEYYYSKALKYGKYNAEAYYNLAMIMAQTGRPVDAIRNYELFLARVPPEYQEMIPEVKNQIKILQQQLITKPRSADTDKSREVTL